MKAKLLFPLITFIILSMHFSVNAEKSFKYCCNCFVNDFVSTILSDDDKFRENSDQLLQSDPFNKNLLLKRALFEAQKMNFCKALEYFQILVNMEPWNTDYQLYIESCRVNIHEDP